MKERKNNRLKGYDYSTEAYYFITSCTKNNIHYFGEIANGTMKLNQYGDIAQTQWHWLAKQYTYIILHAFVVMPNHIHGIIQVWTGRDLSVSRDLSIQMGTPKIKSLSELMGAYKTTVSKQIHLLGNTEFAWHRSFHDHIIRSDEEFERIENYINKNPNKWGNDCFH